MDTPEKTISLYIIPNAPKKKIRRNYNDNDDSNNNNNVARNLDEEFRSVEKQN